MKAIPATLAAPKIEEREDQCGCIAARKKLPSVGGVVRSDSGRGTTAVAERRGRSVVGTLFDPLPQKGAASPLPRGTKSFLPLAKRLRGRSRGGRWLQDDFHSLCRSAEARMVPRTAKPASSGFSLMEVLVGISLLGVCYAVIFSLMTASLRNVSRMDQQEKLARYGQMKLNELVLRTQRGEEGYPLSGTFDESYRWKAEVLPYGIQDGQDEIIKVRPVTLARIRLTIEHESHSPREIYSVETIGWRTKLP
jgi:prepilin-type N-terminal cleavage/methylation domain-containing protein